MTTPVSEKLVTAEEFALLPDPPHGGKMELVEGRVMTCMPVGRPHAKLAARLARIVGTFVDDHALGETHVELGHRTQRAPDTVLAPDVSFFSAAGLLREPVDGFMEGSPTLAIEVMSPEDRESEVASKVVRYLSAGAQRVWVVRPSNQTVTVHRPGGDAHTYSGGDILTSTDASFGVDGFSLPLPTLFA